MQLTDVAKSSKSRKSPLSLAEHLHQHSLVSSEWADPTIQSTLDRAASCARLDSTTDRSQHRGHRQLVEPAARTL